MYTLFKKSLIFCVFPLAVFSGGFFLFALDAFNALPSFLGSYPITNTLNDTSYDARHTFKPDYQGVVVLTGGEERISTSLRLLEKNPSLSLLISGVGPHVTLKRILQKNAPPSFPKDLASHITLGRQAQSTIGNARETADWARKGKIQSLLVVTARYHMRRTLMELRQSAPEIHFIAYPVLPQLLNHPLQKSVLTLLLREYIKLIGSVIHNVLAIPNGQDLPLINQR